MTAAEPMMTARKEQNGGRLTKAGLFIPRDGDAFFPEVGIASWELLERFGCERKGRPDFSQSLPRRHDAAGSGVETGVRDGPAI